MGGAAGPVDIVFDPHVQNALEALLLALVVALFLAAVLFLAVVPFFICLRLLGLFLSCRRLAGHRVHACWLRHLAA